MPPECRVWGYALRLELIVDDPTLSPTYQTHFLLDIQLHPPPNLRRVHFTIRLFFFFFFFLQALEVEIYGVASPLKIKDQCRAQRTKTTFADLCDLKQALSWTL